MLGAQVGCGGCDALLGPGSGDAGAEPGRCKPVQRCARGCQHVQRAFHHECAKTGLCSPTHSSESNRVLVQPGLPAPAHHFLLSPSVTHMRPADRSMSACVGGPAPRGCCDWGCLAAAAAVTAAAWVVTATVTSEPTSWPEVAPAAYSEQKRLAQCSGIGVPNKVLCVLPDHILPSWHGRPSTANRAPPPHTCTDQAEQPAPGFRGEGVRTPAPQRAGCNLVQQYGSRVRMGL